AAGGELGVQAVVPANDEYQLYWGFSFGWGSFDGTLTDGASRIEVAIDKAGEAWRQVDAILITDDLNYTPSGREKPPFAYLSAFDLYPKDTAWRGSGRDLTPQPPSLRGKGEKNAGRDFAMWTAVDYDAKKWDKLDAGLKLYDVFDRFSPPADIR